MFLIIIITKRDCVFKAPVYIIKYIIIFSCLASKILIKIKKLFLINKDFLFKLAKVIISIYILNYLVDNILLFIKV